MASTTDRARPTRPVQLWLALLCGLITLMVVVGGVTRLTGSGLSITEWAPIVGAIPPLNEAQWLEAFGKYQRTPQFQLVNSAMTLGQFKLIFFWEWFHRLLGRSIGVAFLVPFAWLAARGRLDRRLAGRVLVGFALGGLQGALGWFMVKSGLVDRPYVSHYRLAAHLALALLTLSYLFWVLLDLRAAERPAPDPAPAWARRAIRGFTALVGLQILYGALVAGLKAGWGYNTFPLMAGSILPPFAFSEQPVWLNFLENPATVQFTHRVIAWLVLGSALALYLRARRGSAPGSRERRAFGLLLGLVCGQFALGVATLLLMVPVSLGALHQLGGCAVLLACVLGLHSLRASPARLRRPAAPASGSAQPAPA